MADRRILELPCGRRRVQRHSRLSPMRRMPATASPKSAGRIHFKSQLMAYEGVRAMYEAYSRNKYDVDWRGAMDAKQRLAIDHLAPL